jgi:hypothetical protein
MGFFAMLVSLNNQHQSAGAIFIALNALARPACGIEPGQCGFPDGRRRPPGVVHGRI